MANPKILQRHIESIGNPGMGLPSFPDFRVQSRYVGHSGEAALREAWPFFELVTDRIFLSPDSRVLDFGVGWGRIARFFDGLVDPKNLLLADVGVEALHLTKECGVRGELIKIENGKKFPMDGGVVDLVYAYSVFSHISEASAQHWLQEIARVVCVGGFFVFTTCSMRFLNLVRACKMKPDANPMQRQIGDYIVNIDDAIRTFQSGGHVFSATGGGANLPADSYGWAAVPRDWLEREAKGLFEIDDYIDSPSVSDQAVFVLRRI